MGTIRDYKYKILKNFLTPDEVKLGTHYFKLCHKRNMEQFDDVQNNNADSFFNSDAFTDSLLMNKKNIIEKETGLELYPTYTFSRIYTFNAELKKHKDRPSCEISITLMWDSDGTKWPIYMDGNPIELEPGDGAIYLGCEVEHYRENFKGDYHIQSFLHYVDKNGKYEDYKHDKRTQRDNAEVEW